MKIKLKDIFEWGVIILIVVVVVIGGFYMISNAHYVGPSTSHYDELTISDEQVKGKYNCHREGGILHCTGDYSNMITREVVYYE